MFKACNPTIRRHVSRIAEQGLDVYLVCSCAKGFSHLIVLMRDSWPCHALHRGQRSRGPQAGGYGNSPQGMPNQRQQQHRNLGGGYQNGEAHSSTPVGTKLQGHIDSIKGSFGFIRSDFCIPLFFRNSIKLRNYLWQDHAGHVPAALLRRL